MYGTLVSAVKDEAEKRRILAALVNHDGMTYDELDGHTNVSRRRTRDRVYDLQDDGIVETTNSNIVFVHFVNTEVKVLAEDALSLFF